MGRRPKILIHTLINAADILHRSVFVKTLPLRGRVSILTSRCKM
jgi:hypothetical protein